ncbi:WD repeat-containing protein on Y chromosome-like [Limulus polyphemus]|uniref:WD repeat-containing protein on Y chromosome n=1 Tax=Limulus polyphemus TaxID=6850 RepID=A0ABM1B6F1_LIMPO|nr:WD repeat-containing protein on Y chromosome-like [Limulus polyphemus]
MESAQEKEEECSQNEKLEDKLNFEHLKRLQRLFEEMDTDGSGALDMDEFKTAMTALLGGHMDEHELELMFMKIDTNCDGTVDWEEYLNYMLLEYLEKDSMSSTVREKPFHGKLRLISNIDHRGSIVRISFYPSSLQSISDSDNLSGRYLTLSNEGNLCFWSNDMNLIKTIYIHENNLRIRKAWMTDMVCLPNVSLLAISTTDRDIQFFDSNPSKCEQTYQIVAMNHCVVAMNYYFNPLSPNEAYMVVGDTGGSVYCLCFSQCLVDGLFGSLLKKQRSNRQIYFKELLGKAVPGLSVLSFPGLHDNWIRQVRYVPQLTSFISCAASSNFSMCNYDVQGQGRYVYRLYRGITCFDYSESQNFIITGAMDHTVRVWNPHVTSKSVLIIQGHLSAITHVSLQDELHQAITISEDNYIKVWDIRDQRCVQTIKGDALKSLGRSTISSAFFNQFQQILLLGTSKLGYFGNIPPEGEISEGAKTSHPKCLCGALYNSLFNYVISTCHGSVITVWDLNTGDKIIQFNKCHKITKIGVYYPVEITAMTLDPTERRLITGGRDGTVKIWNFNNGACLREMKTIGKTEITSILCQKEYIIVAGWNKHVTAFLDSADDDSYKIWTAKHKDDIVAMDYYKGSLLATASYDGEIILWLLETGHVSKRLRETYSQPESGVQKNSDFSTNVNMPKESGAEGNVVENSTPGVSDVLGSVSDVYGNQQCNSSLSSNKPTLREDSVFIRCFDSDTVSVNQLLFLKTREVSPEVAVLLATAKDGFVRAWSIHQNGQILGKFYAPKREDQSVTCMTTDQMNNFLFTGDSSGYIRTWSLSTYGIPTVTGEVTSHVPQFTYLSHENKESYLRQFPYLRFEISNSIRTRRMAEQSPTCVQFSTYAIGEPPLLLNSYRAHVEKVVHLNFIEGKNLLISSSKDCCVRLWTLGGKFIGTFGQREQWNLHGELLITNTVVRQNLLPPDVRRIASATTLKVFNEGKCPHWVMALNIISLFLGNFKKEIPTKITESNLEQQTVKPAISKSILGKFYEPQKRHKPPPQLFSASQINRNMAVFNALPCASLDDSTQETLLHVRNIVTRIQRSKISARFKSILTSKKSEIIVKFENRGSRNRRQSRIP